MKERIEQLSSNGVTLLNDANYEEALKIFTSLKRLDKARIYLWYYYEGVIYELKGDDESDSKSKENFYFTAVELFFQAVDYHGIPLDTYFLLGRALYKVGELNRALSIFQNNPYPIEKKGEVEAICSQIKQQLNNNSSPLWRGSDYNIPLQKSSYMKEFEPRTAIYRDARDDSFFSTHNLEFLNRVNLSDTQIISVNNSYNTSYTQISPFNNRYNEISTVDTNSGYVTRQEHNRVLAKLESLEQRLENTENRVEIVEDKVETIENILQAANIYTEAAVNIKIQELYKNSPKLHTYYNYFNLGLRDIYVASCSVNSGLVVGNAGHLERLDPNDCAKIVCYLFDVVIPFLGPIKTAAIGLAHDIFGNLFNSHVEGNVVKVLENINMLMNKQYDLTMKMETVIQQIALLFTHINEDKILKIEETTIAKQSKFLKFLREKILPTQKKLFSRYENTDNDDPVVKLAFKDLTLLMCYMQRNATEMLKNPKSFAEQIAMVIEKELGKLWEDKIQNNPIRIEYKLTQIADKLPKEDVTKIMNYIQKERWENKNLGLIKFGWESPLFFIGSWKGVKKGIDGFADSNYYATLCTKKNSTLQLTDITYFLLFIFREICKSKKTKCIELFFKKHPDIIDYAANNAPELFVNEEAINICFKDDIARQNATKIGLKLKSPDQFVKDCVGKIFHNLPSGQRVNFIIESKPEPVRVLEFESDDCSLKSLFFEMNEDGVVTVAGVESKPKPAPNLEFESDDLKVIPFEVGENDKIIVAGDVNPH